MDMFELTPQEHVSEQRKALEALLSRLGPEASDEKVAQFLSTREPAEPEADLKPEAVALFKQRVGQVKVITELEQSLKDQV